LETAPNAFLLADLAKLAQVRQLTLRVDSDWQFTTFFAGSDVNLLSRITSLTIYGDCSPESVLVARQLPHLRELHLRTDWFYDEEVAKLERTFAGVKIVPTGDPRRPPYRREQIAIRRWNPFCELSSDAQTLKLSDLELTAERIKQIERILPRLENLTLTRVDIPLEVVDTFGQMTSLEKIKFADTTPPESLLHHLARLPSLILAAFKAPPPSAEAMRALKSRPELTLLIDGREHVATPAEHRPTTGTPPGDASAP
jgi:hypothetical protein